MERKLDADLVRRVVEEQGMTYTAVAKKLGVSVESVSKWLRGDAVPRPGKALGLGMLLNLSYEQMFGKRDLGQDPQVSFRITRNRKPSEEHRNRAREMGQLFEQLVPYLPFSPFEAPKQLKNPRCDKEYLNALAEKLRSDIGCDATGPVPLKGLFSYLSEELQAVIVPVLWNHRANKAELAAHIYSPSTRTTWMPFNLDTKSWDARFWIAHELAHALTFDVLKDEAASEKFADALAGALVVPETVAQAGYERASAVKAKSARHGIALDIARQMHCSPVCVAKRIDQYAEDNQQPKLGLDESSLYAFVNRFEKKERSLAEEIFPDGAPAVSEFIRVSEDYLRTPFFGVLRKYLKKNGSSSAFIQGILDCPLTDAKALASELQ